VKCVTISVILPSFYCMQDVFLSSMTLCNTRITRSVLTDLHPPDPHFRTDLRFEMFTF